MKTPAVRRLVEWHKRNLIIDSEKSILVDIFVQKDMEVRAEIKAMLERRKENIAHAGQSEWRDGILKEYEFLLKLL